MLGYVPPALEPTSCGFKSNPGFPRQLFERGSVGTQTLVAPLPRLPSASICASQPGSGLLFLYFFGTKIPLFPFV